MKRTRPRLTLPRVTGQPRDRRAGLACWGAQLEELRRRAEAANMSVSRYLNELLWADWLAQVEAPRRVIRFRKAKAS